MVSVNTIAASHPYLQVPPLVEAMANSLGWLLYALALAEWHQGDHGTTAATMVEKCSRLLILLVFLFVVLCRRNPCNGRN
jgi:hypothetical protein